MEFILNFNFVGLEIDYIKLEKKNFLKSLGRDEFYFLIFWSLSKLDFPFHCFDDNFPTAIFKKNKII